MTRAEFLQALEESFEVDQGTLEGNETLEDLECWDSMSALIYMALADEKLGITVSGEQIINCKTVNDLLDLLDDKLAA